MSAIVALSFTYLMEFILRLHYKKIYAFLSILETWLAIFYIFTLVIIHVYGFQDMASRF